MLRSTSPRTSRAFFAAESICVVALGGCLLEFNGVFAPTGAALRGTDGDEDALNVGDVMVVTAGFLLLFSAVVRGFISYFNGK